MGDRPNAAKWRNERKLFRRGPGTPYRKLQSLKFLATRDRPSVVEFLLARYPTDLPIRRRLKLLAQYVAITNALRGYHTLSELLTATDRIVALAGRPNPQLVEAGAGSGSSTAKLSLAARLVGGTLHVFDTFQGIPDNNEQHYLMDGTPLSFSKGAFRGRLGAVKRRVAQYGAIEVCQFYKGPIETTLAQLPGPVDMALLDLDLVASTRAAIAHLFPKLQPHGCLLSQDGHLRGTHDLLNCTEFWRSIGQPSSPAIRRHHGGKLLEISPAAPSLSSKPWHKPPAPR